MVEKKITFANGMIIDLSNIVVSNDKYQWGKSIGAKIPFLYNGIDDYFILSNYKNSKIVIEYKGLTKTVSPGHFLRKERCGGVTDLFNRIALLKPYLIDYVEDKELFYSLSYGSKKKIWIKCPYCGHREYISARTFYKRVNTCPICSDGISYPEKFVSCMLNQLNIKYEKYISFAWSDHREYDFYFELNNKKFIIETHGSQHYQEEFERISENARTLEEEHTNDIYKEELAKEHIDYYIKFECSESTKEHMINAIYNSLFHVIFIEVFNKIDFDECDYFATNNSIFRDVCNLWNSNNFITTTDIAKKLNLDINTVIKYLKRGNDHGMCKYSKEIGNKRGRIKYEKNRYRKTMKEGVT